ncbi:CLUMA_CG005534, isoform A [Clunio marinus]|uniref:CLUMA_CG005534, isoform A n=1 Tax=Clunio marinus TaxID=568069 RepID=A0A1J1HV87_9DIPT|nr:CLUMA_CG005534, isoform A [Clunio marinus]
MENDKYDLSLRDRLPAETWCHIISYLPRITRQSLAQLCGFMGLVADTSQLEDRRLYQALKHGNLRWHKVTHTRNIQPRLRHGTINFNDQLVIFGGASNNLPNSGTYNDVWKFDFIKKFHRMTTLGIGPSPRANFGFVRAGDRILMVGGRSSNSDPFTANQSPFEIHILNPHSGAWQKVITTGTDPQHSNGIRCVMLSSTELVAVAGLIPTFHNWMQEILPDGNFEHLRTSMQVSILKFSDSTKLRGTWHRIADWYHNRRGMPTPRTEFHLTTLGNDYILMLGGRSTNHTLQDAWVMKIVRYPNYGVKWTPIIIENPLAPPLPLHLYPSSMVGDLMVFAGVRTIMKKPGIDKPKEEPKKQQQQEQQPANSPATSSQQNTERRTPIYINLERPLNTIGAMAAFSVSTQPVVPPQKVLKIQMASEPSPEPPKRPQDYPMRIFCLDLSPIMNVPDEAFRTNPTIHWLTMRNEGLFANAPELRAHGTFTPFDNGIILIGGVRRSQTDDDVLFTQATNEVYILDYVNET